MGRNSLIIVVVVALVVVGAYLLLRGASNYSSAPAPAGSQATPTSQITPTSASSSQIQEISISNFAFVPQTVTVKKGTTVRWTNTDNVPHRIVSDPNGSIFMGPDQNKGDSYMFTFNQTGSFPYHCGIHPFMKGSVTVTD